MINNEEKKQLIKIAKMYYFEELTQAEIAKKIGISRPVISKMLRKAREEEIVRITINDEGFDLVEVEQKIASFFGLSEVIITSTENMSSERTLQALGKATADYVSKSIRSIEKIGVSWGKSLLEMVHEYPIEQREQIKVIPLVGGMGPKDVELHSNQIAYEFAKKINGQCESLYAPAMVATNEQKESLIQLPFISSVLEQGKHVDLAIVGIGNPFEHSTMYEIGYLGDEDLHELRQAQVVGDISSKYILEDGSLADLAINRRVIGIDLSDLKQISKVIGVATGLYKIDSILAALRGGYLDVLITDDKTAYRLVDQMDVSTGKF
jgi:DNA-binding transcriptional regulator LsrR (DeoR family)